MTYNLFKISKELNESIRSIVEYLTSKGIEVENKPIAEISNEVRQLLLHKFGNVMVNKKKPKTLKKDRKRKEVIINEKEKEVLLSIYNDLGKKKIKEFIDSKYEESNKLRKLLEYLPSYEVDKKIESILLKLYFKVAQEKWLHPLEELVKDWNKKHNYILKRKKILDIDAYNKMKKSRRENITKIIYNNLTFYELQQILQYDETEYSKILLEFGIENKPQVKIGIYNYEKLKKIIVKRLKEMEEELIKSEKEKKIQDQQENDKRRKKKLKEKIIVMWNQRQKVERNVDKIKSYSISTKSSVYPIYTPMKD